MPSKVIVSGRSPRGESLLRLWKACFICHTIQKNVGIIATQPILAEIATMFKVPPYHPISVPARGIRGAFSLGTLALFVLEAVLVDEDAVLCFQKSFDEFLIVMGVGFRFVWYLAHILGRVHVIGGCT